MLHPITYAAVAFCENENTAAWWNFYNSFGFKYKIIKRFECETFVGVNNYSRYSNIAFFGLHEGE